jgi:hypothetical protein
MTAATPLTTLLRLVQAGSAVQLPLLGGLAATSALSGPPHRLLGGDTSIHDNQHTADVSTTPHKR